MKNLKWIIGAVALIALIVTMCTGPLTSNKVTFEDYQELQVKYDNLQIQYKALQQEVKLPTTLGFVTTAEHEAIMAELVECRINKIEVEHETTIAEIVKPVVFPVFDDTMEVAEQILELREFYGKELFLSQDKLLKTTVNLNECRTKVAQFEVDNLRTNATKFVTGKVKIDEATVVDYVAEVKGELIALDADIDILDLETLPTPQINSRDNYIGLALATVFDIELKPMVSLEYMKLKKRTAWGISGGAQWSDRTDIAPHISIRYGVRF